MTARGRMEPGRPRSAAPQSWRAGCNVLSVLRGVESLGPAAPV